MARTYLMNFQGAPQYRWRKTVRGVNYEVACHELSGVTIYTAEGSYRQANEWFRNQMEKAEGKADPLRKTLEAYTGQPIDDAAGLDASFRDLVKDVAGDQSENARRLEALRTLLAGLKGEVEPSAGGAAARDAYKPTTKKPERRLRKCADDWLAVIAGNSKPLTYREIRNYVNSLVAMLGDDFDVSRFDADAVRQTYLTIKNATLEDSTRKKRWGFYVRFIDFLGENGIIPVPGNLHSKSFKFKVDTKAVKVYPLDAVRAVLAGCTPRQRLYAMLGLNCGMTSADIGQLTRDMIVGNKLTRKRVKTRRIVAVPTVTYTIWPETMALLEECKSSHPTLVLTGRTGQPLWESRQEGDKTPQKDMISQQWKRAKIAINIKAFRSISATEIESHNTYGRFTVYFLGQSPKSIKDKHYAAPAGDEFEACLSWLRSRILGV